MRIAHLIDSLDYGGAEQVVASLAASQARHGDFVRLICLRDLGPNPVDTDALRSAGAEIFCLEKPDGLHFGTLLRLIDYLKRNRVEIVHTHNHLVHHYGALAARFSGAQAISTLHGSASLRNAPRWTQQLYRFSCLLGSRVAAVASEVETSLQTLLRLPAGKVCVVENGIDLTPFLRVPRRVPSKAVVFGTIGRLEPVKGHDVLLQAFAAVRRDHPEVQLRILGDGSQRDPLHRLARTLSVEPSVHFEGFSLDTARFLESIDIYVISSRSEGLPLTLLEAMGAALPVVSTAVGAIPDILRRASRGFICAPSDPDELAAAMRRAIEVVSTQGGGEGNREFVAREYALERMVRDYREVYRAVLTEAVA